MAGTSLRILKKALRDPMYVLKDVDDRREEQSTYQARNIESKEPTKQVKRGQIEAMSLCGGPYPHNKGPCPAKGKECCKCGKQNHFAKGCRGKQQQQ
jgi:hypothetical protein